MELEAQLKIRRPEELKVFNSLSLSMVVVAEILLEVFADVAGRIELEARVEIWQPEELEVLLVAVRY